MKTGHKRLGDWQMTLEDLELMPEPEDGRLLTAVDPEAPGYSGSDYGLTDEEA